MNTLEFCHELDFSKIDFVERKNKITHPKTLIYGPFKSGKSFLIYDYLSNFEVDEYIYVDFDDPRNDLDEIKDKLEDYVRKSKIKVTVLENFKFDMNLPFCDSIIISTKEERKIKGFKNLFLNPLDFEEYILHDNKHQTETVSFNSLLKYGNLPEFVNSNDFEKHTKLQELLKLKCENQTHEEVLKMLLINIDEKKSLNQMFLSLKSKIKISKDKFYELCKKFENEKIIYFIPKIGQEKASKKIYSFNPAFLSAITLQKKFKNEFTNLVFLELLKKQEDIFYLDYVDFYIKSQKIAIITIPFFNSMLMQGQLKRIFKGFEEYEVEEIFIITISNSEEFLFKEKLITVMPFYEWAVT